ncbi:MAG: sugar fermentation stimulation protein [Clostridiales bacterium]|jgi:sugar fermentation stimulation protein A|nr:sugar fermentation stimulation protein [Clostridiales bacterium]
MKELITIKGPLVQGIFRARPNRYIAEVEVDGVIQTVHVHDPGRLRELLFPGNPCIIRYAASPTRKTDWDMVAARKETADGAEEYVLIHSGYHRAIAEAILENPALNPFGLVQSLRAEVPFGHSRIDFLLTTSENTPLWVEVKGCSLSEQGVAKFPDAPTVRGTKHLKTLMDIRENGNRSGVLLLIFSESHYFEPKADTDPLFAQTFYKAQDAGVEVHPVRVCLDKNSGTVFFSGEIAIGNPRRNMD